MDIFGHYEVGDKVDFPASSGYDQRANVRNSVMVEVTPRAKNGQAVFVKDYEVVRILDLTDPATLDITKETIGQFDAMLIHPQSVPDGAMEKAVEETRAKNRKELS